jgi:hypothetical protein
MAALIDVNAPSVPNGSTTIVAPYEVNVIILEKHKTKNLFMILFLLSNLYFIIVMIVAAKRASPPNNEPTKMGYDLLHLTINERRFFCIT